MMELIDKKKLIADLNEVREALSAQGDPFLASIMTRAIGVVENQTVVQSAESECKEEKRWTYNCTCCYSVISPRIAPPDYCPVCGVRTRNQGFSITDLEV